MIVIPRIMVLDTSQLGEMSRDYWNSNRYHIVRETIDELAAANWYIGLTFSHVAELIRHHDDRLVSDRLDFLRVLPHVAWIRPYDGNWFPGGIIDVHLREIECRFESPNMNADSLVDHLRSIIWETGTGAEIIQKDFQGWGPLRSQSQSHLHDDIYIASISRPDAGRIRNMTLAEICKLPIRPKNERAPFLQSFAVELHRQLLGHGDRRLTAAESAARSFALDALKRVEEAEQDSENPALAILLDHGIDEESLEPSMTMEDLELLAVFARRLLLLGERLRPPRSLTLREMNMECLPSWLVIRELMRAHGREDRVSGSNLGDSDIAGAGLYADICVVDKRTHNYLHQSHQRVPSLNKLLDRYKKTSNYRGLMDCVSANSSSV